MADDLVLRAAEILEPLVAALASRAGSVNVISGEAQVTNAVQGSSITVEDGGFHMGGPGR